MKEVESEEDEETSTPENPQEEVDTEEETGDEQEAPVAVTRAKFCKYNVVTCDESNI